MSSRAASPSHSRLIFPPFHCGTAWRTVDDRIRGGSSISHLELYQPHRAGEDTPESSVSDVEGETWVKVQSASSKSATNNDGAVRFWGTLDTKTLGGAGFASQAWRPPPAPSGSDHPNRLDLPASRYEGLRITYLPIPSGPVTKLTLVLKTKIGHRRPDGRLQSELSWEHTIDAMSNVRPKLNTSASLDIPWSDFAATYRGRPISPDDPEYYPFIPGRETDSKNDQDAEGIAEISFMCRSAFGKQEGDFEFVIVSLEAIAKRDSSSSAASMISSDPEKATLVEKFEGEASDGASGEKRSFLRDVWDACASALGHAVGLLAQGWRSAGSWLAYLFGTNGVRLD